MSTGAKLQMEFTKTELIQSLLKTAVTDAPSRLNDE